MKNRNKCTEQYTPKNELHTLEAFKQKKKQAGKEKHKYESSTDQEQNRIRNNNINNEMLHILNGKTTTAHFMREN